MLLAYCNIAQCQIFTLNHICSMDPSRLIACIQRLTVYPAVIASETSWDLLFQMLDVTKLDIYKYILCTSCAETRRWSLNI